MASKNEYLKFSFYGRTAVGKTSMLAALDMPRVGVDEKGGKIIPLQNVTPSDPQGDSEAAQLQRGHAAVTTAVLELRDPGKGRAQATAVDDRVMQIRCEFPSSKPNGPLHNVVLYEYAGEILESAELNNEASLIQNLHKMLEDRDAFLVVVEAPISRARIADFTNDMHKLRKAFAAIRNKKAIEGKLHIPVLMLITKWDRYEPNPDPETQDERLEQFFTDYPTFKSVRDDLASGVNEDMFEVFPVSALGTVENDGTDNPKCKFVDGALQSYGLGQPFIWAAEKVKEQRRAKSARMVRIWQRSAFAVIVTLIACLLVGDALQWNRAYSVARRIAEMPTGDPQPYTNLLTGYIGSNWWKNFLLKAGGYSKEDVRKELIDFERKPQETAWAEIVSEPDSIKKTKLARAYINKWPQGIYSVQCNAIINLASIDADKKAVTRITQRVKDRIEIANETELRSLLKEVEDVRGKLKNPEQFATDVNLLITQIGEQIRQRKSDIDRKLFEKLRDTVDTEILSAPKSRLEELLSKIDPLKSSLNFPEDYRLQTDNLKDRIRKRMDGIKLDAEREKFKARLVSELDSKNYLEAGDSLDSRYRAEPNPDWLKPLVSIFLKQLPDGYKQKLSDYTLNNRWEEGDDLLKKLETRMTSWHSEIKSEDIFQSVRTSKKEFDIAHDKYRYQQVIDGPTTIIINRYLKIAPLLTMAKQVEAYKSWIARTPPGDQEYNFTLTGFVWDSKAYTRNNRVQVWYEDKEIINIEKVPSVTGQPTVIPSSAQSRFSWNPQKKKKVNIRIKVTGDGYFDFNHGDGADEFKLDSGAEQLKLPSADGYGTQKANFTIEPVDAKPELPPWSNR